MQRSVWVKPRPQEYWNAIKAGVLGENWWIENLRMTKTTFSKLTSELHPHLTKSVTRLRMPIPVDQQVAVTICRLATNVEYQTISAVFGTGISTVCEIVHRTCHAMIEHMLPKYVKMPSNERMKEIIEEFETLWGFPQVIGAIDDSHIPILKPADSPSDYFNWKGFYSIIIQGVVDSHGLFMDVNIGWPGKVHDARVFHNSTFYSKCHSGRFLPDWKQTINGIDIPLVFLGDPAYPLLPWLMKPYPDTGSLTRQQQHYNYRQSRARMVVENAFGRLKGRWRCLLKCMDYYNIQYTTDAVVACVILHNICELNRDYCNPNWIVDDAGQDHSAPHVDMSRQSTESATRIRDMLKDYLYLH